MLLVLGIIGLIAAGCLIAYAVVMTFKWIRNKIKEKLAKKNVKKVAVADIEKLVNECENKMSMSDLDDLVDNGYTNIMVEVDDNGKVVGEVDVIKDENDTLDKEVERMIGKKGMVVIEG